MKTKPKWRRRVISAGYINLTKELNIIAAVSKVIG
jgi:hypothetical protein